MSEKEQIQQAISGKRVAILGDVMLDRYIVGRVDRMSPEAPVPVLVQEKSQSRLGGAANVALNISSLGSTPIVCSIIGDDQAGGELQHLLQELGDTDHYLVKSNERQTTVKTRLLGNNQHLLRLDSESQSMLSANENEQVMLQLVRLFDQESIDVLILQDYNKGLLNQTLIKFAIQECQRRKIFVAVDPKFDNFFIYENVDLFKPNLKEISQALGRTVNPIHADLNDACGELIKRLSLNHAMITLSDKGIFIKNKDGTSDLSAVQKSEIVDVCGAGDAVLAVAALMFHADLGVDMIGRVANIAGKAVCQKIGVAPVTSQELISDV